MQFSGQYLGAVAIIIVAAFQFFKVDVTEAQVTAVLSALIALYVAIKRYNKGDISTIGIKEV